MPLLPLPSPDQTPEASKTLLQKLQAKLGMVPNIFRLMGHAPAVLEHTLGLNAAIQSDLPPKLRELAYLKASQVNGCPYCEHYHRALGKKAGLADAQVLEVGRYEDSAAYDPLEKAVLRFAEQWSRGGGARPEVVRDLRESLSPAQLVTLAATVALAGWTNKFNTTFAVELP